MMERWTKEKLLAEIEKIGSPRRFASYNTWLILAYEVLDRAGWSRNQLLDAMSR
jgi:hypothetical protein